MTKPLNALIIADATDPLAHTWQKLCRQAGHQAVCVTDEDLEEHTIEIPADFQADVFIHTWSYFWVHPLCEEHLKPDCLLLAHHAWESLADIYSGQKLLPRTKNLVGYSGIGLYANQTTLEITQNTLTSPQAFAGAQEFLATLGLTAIEVPEVPGLIFGRILAMLVNEATSALMEGVASPADIDTAMRLGTNYPLGPLEWADRVGLDVIRTILSSLKNEYGEERYRPMPLLTQKVQAGELGVKTGQGFYAYPPEPQAVTGV